jgi:hypothetical protein
MGPGLVFVAFDKRPSKHAAAVDSATPTPPILTRPYPRTVAGDTMGGYLSKFSALVWAKKEIRILILGLVCALQPAACLLGLPMRTGQRGQDNASVQTQGACSPVA